jgi:hypothetical protein
MRPILSLTRIAFMLSAVFTAFVSQEIRHSTRNKKKPPLPTNAQQFNAAHTHMDRAASADERRG